MYVSVCHSGQHISIMALLDFIFVSQDLINIIHISGKRCLNIGFPHSMQQLFYIVNQ